MARRAAAARQAGRHKVVPWRWVDWVAAIKITSFV
jgi:hypothetical protein